MKPKKTQRVFSAQAVSDTVNAHNVVEKTKSYDNRAKCIVCSLDHPLWKCTDFHTKPVSDKWDIVKRERLCFNCLSKGHASKDCKSSYKCKHCNKLHHTLLHRNPTNQNQTSNHNTKRDSSNQTQNTSENANVASAAVHTIHKVRLKVVPVVVWGRKNNTKVETYAFLDEGSDTTFCTKRLINKLGIAGKEISCNVTGMNGTQMLHGNIVTLSIKGINEENAINIDNVFAVDKIPEVTSSIPTNDDCLMQRWALVEQPDQPGFEPEISNLRHHRV